MDRLSNHTTEQIPGDIVSDIRIKEQIHVVSSLDEEKEYKLEVTSGTQQAFSRIGPGVTNKSPSLLQNPYNDSLMRTEKIDNDKFGLPVTRNL